MGRAVAKGPSGIKGKMGAVTQNSIANSIAQLAAVLAGETDLVANTANMAALIYHGLPDLNWAGFYFRRGDELALGPFRGRPVCVRIPIGSGVCGGAVSGRDTNHTARRRRLGMCSLRCGASLNRLLAKRGDDERCETPATRSHISP